MTPEQIAEQWAGRIADDLFTNGNNEHGSRLVLELPDGRDGGGWCESAVRDHIKTELLPLVEACEEFRIGVLHDREDLADAEMDTDQTNAVLSLFDGTIGEVLDALEGTEHGTR